MLRFVSQRLMSTSLRGNDALSQYEWKEEDVVLPTGMKKAGAVYVPHADAVFAFTSKKAIHRLHKTMVWYPQDELIGDNVPSADQAFLVNSEKEGEPPSLVAVGQKGLMEDTRRIIAFRLDRVRTERTEAEKENTEIEEKLEPTDDDDDDDDDKLLAEEDEEHANERKREKEAKKAKAKVKAKFTDGYSYQGVILGECPVRLLNWTGAAVGSRIVFFGETYFDQVADNDVNVQFLNVASGQWLSPEVSGESPRRRAGIRAVAHPDGERVMVFEPDDDTLMYRLHLFDTGTMSWSEQPLGVQDGAALPHAAQGASFTLLGNKVVVFGGLLLGSFSSATHVLDIDRWQWEKVDVRGAVPSARSEHAGVSLSDSSMLLLGGSGVTLQGSALSIYSLEKINSTVQQERVKE
jgi:Galactose oxidase, central domain